MRGVNVMGGFETKGVIGEGISGHEFDIRVSDGWHGVQSEISDDTFDEAEGIRV